MTAPFIAEAERAAAEALAKDCLAAGLCDAVMHQWEARAVVAAVVPILAEHLAQAVLALDYENDGPAAPEWVDRDDVLAVIREAATPTEGGTT